MDQGAEFHFITPLTGNFQSYQPGDCGVEVHWLPLKQVLERTLPCPHPGSMTATVQGLC